MASDTLLVVTAGHIDHGKSALVQALTGTVTDTLPEEVARGITIALGFAHLDLPGGRRVAFVDAPGHERFVRTMAAGAHGVDAALLVVAADDGVMPQTREHLAVLDLLGVPDGVVVVTKIDAVDPELVALVVEEVTALTEGTVFAARPVLPVSAHTGAGLEALRDALATLHRRERPADGPFRLPVDRAFSRPGFGTVVTGTSVGGTLVDGATVTLLPGGGTARVRGLQLQGEPAASVGPGLRVALNLAGVDTDAVPRGTVVARGEVPCPQVLDIAYVHVHADVPLEDGASVRVLLGTAECTGRLHLAGDGDLLVDGDEAYAQLRLEAPLPCLPGDRLVVRRTSPVVTLGGGRVLDPWAPRMRGRDRKAWAEALARLDAGDAAVWLERAGEVGIDAATWAARGVDGGVVLGDRVLARGLVGRLEGVVLEALRLFHEASPLAMGMPRRQLHGGRLSHLSDRSVEALLERMAGRKVVALDGPLVRLATFQVTLDPAAQARADAVLAVIAEAGLVGVTSETLAAGVGGKDVEALLRVLERQQRVVRVADLGWVGPAALTTLRDALRAWFDAQAHDPTALLTPAAFRDRFDLTRKSTLPWLAYTDKVGWTRRLAEGRARGEALGTTG
ncbi:MAG: selenocysteine-specific translation elongation factor [Alphaproteobacteria bacterium]|nr:selenocysteine-specific translation elongation factor [Alphaproteobacteria bacterium]